jgi:sugar/nucleoside kinase (ribokinase family)
MLGQIGDDSDGKSYLDFLNSNGVDAALVLTSKNHHTGQAYIF